jgi:uncharacterized membrane protein
LKKKITRQRHIAKSFTWRIVATITTTMIAWTISGDPSTGFTIGSIEFFVKMPIYYFHERAWYRSNWGIKKQKNDSQ